MGYINKIPIVDCMALTTEVYFFRVMKSRNLRSGCQQGQALVRTIPGLQMAIFLPSAYMAFSLTMHRKRDLSLFLFL